jgi:hypothetical protein
LRTVIWDFASQPIPADTLTDLGRLQHILNQRSSPLLAELKYLITDHEIKMFKRRLDQLIASGTFPSPGAGRNVPFPPI